VRWLTPLLGAVVVAQVACVPRPQMCTSKTECDSSSACVAGRCQLDKPTVKPAVDGARRLVVRPVDVAYLRSGDGPSGGGLPGIFTLGKDGGRLFLRFSVAVPPTASVVEAYVVLRRSSLVDDDPAPISLHATRIVEPWEGGSVSWAFQPRVREVRSPSTAVGPGGRSIVRVDVRELVRLWPRRDADDQGIQIVAEKDTRTGTTFALNSSGAERGVDAEPYLELYLR
jgi:hypothetical protein